MNYSEPFAKIAFSLKHDRENQFGAEDSIFHYMMSSRFQDFWLTGISTQSSSRKERLRAPQDKGCGLREGISRATWAVLPASRAAGIPPGDGPKVSPGASASILEKVRPAVGL